MKPSLFLGLFIGLFVTACQNNPLPPAPLGERAVLEKLAATYETLSEQLPVSPSGLTPQGKLKFVQEVFTRSGYDYAATAHEVALTAPQELTTYHRDMMELLLLPGQGLNQQDRQALYDSAQLADIEQIIVLSQR